MSKGYKGAVSVVQAVGAVGPLCYTTGEVAGQEFEAMVDTQSSATILFQRGWQPTLTQKWSVNPTETSHCSLSQTDVGPRKSDDMILTVNPDGSTQYSCAKQRQWDSPGS